MNNNKKPNFLHYTGAFLLLVGWFLFLQVKLVEGFSALFIGCVIGLIGCEYDSAAQRRRKDD